MRVQVSFTVAHRSDSRYWNNNLEQSSGRSATPLAVTAVIWTKTETVFVWAMSAPEEFCLKSRYTNDRIIIIITPCTGVDKASK